MLKPPGGDPVATLPLPSLSTSYHGTEHPASEHGAEIPASEHRTKLPAFEDEPGDAEWREKERRSTSLVLLKAKISFKIEGIHARASAA